MADSDKRLSTALRAARHGDQDAFRRLYGAVQPRLLRYLRVLVGDAADQMAAQTWRDVAHGLCDFRGDFQRFCGWVTLTGRDRALDHMSGRSRAEAFQERPGLVENDDRVAPMIEPLSTEAAITLIAALPGDEAEAVMLHAVMGLDFSQAAPILGRSPEAVQAAANQGLRHLADRLEPSSEPPGAEDEPGPGPAHRPQPGTRGDR
ncbi:RNA polymerase sigma factor [Actinomadura sp. 3N508]|uniref:RNA polymerase sigma factor n=1 Tax=Actinomadura sp. 3N508 TaxID=3375153 RepID=UPI0037A30256